MRLLRNKVLVEKDPIKQGAFLMPNKKSLTGVVINHGPGIKGDPISVKKGDRVKFHEHAGVPYNHEGKDCLFLLEPEIIAIL
ncbi:co-chaperone GroES family protein [Galbibacter sp. BG1]